MDDIPEAEGNWMFEGTPAVTDGGVFVAMSRPGPRPACGLAALHPETGRVRWFRVTCEGTPRWRSEEDRGRIDDGRRHVMAELSHSLVTVAEGRVFHTTHLGAVVALDERTGRWEWGATYPQGLVPDVIGFAARRFHGPSPALCAGGFSWSRRTIRRIFWGWIPRRDWSAGLGRTVNGSPRCWGSPMDVCTPAATRFWRSMWRRASACGDTAAATINWRGGGERAVG